MPTKDKQKLKEAARRYREKNKNNPEYRERVRANNKAYRERLKQDPQRLAKVNEYKRKWKNRFINSV